MKWDNTDLRVGLMVFGGLLLGIASFLWIGRLWSRDVAPLYTDVADVQGIGPESPVFLNGFNVGRVSAVEPRVDSTGQLLFRVKMDVVWRLQDGAAMPLKDGLRARVVPPALDIGRGTIVLEPAPSDRDMLVPGALIPSVQQGGTTNRMQLVVDSVGRDMRIAIGQIEKLISQLSVTVSTATSAMKTTSSMMATVNQDVPMIMASVKSNLASADSLMRSLHTVTPATVATLDSVRALLGDSRIAVAKATSFLDSNEPQLSSTIANLDQASAVLNNLLKEVSRRPIKALTGVKPPELPTVTANGTNGQATATKRP
jgi:ABC-type transporter Mla subunit MlaD